MFNRKFDFLLLLFIVIAMLVIAPVAHAQDATPEPTAVVVAPAPMFINAETGMSVSTLAYGVIIAILSGGTVAVILTRFGGNKQNLDAMEKLYQSQSPDAQARERELFLGLRDVTLRVIDIVDKVTDNQPNVEVPAQTIDPSKLAALKPYEGTPLA